MPTDERKTLADHIAALWAQINALTASAVELKGVKAKAASDAADRLERRVSRMMRAAAHLDGQDKRARERAGRLAKSKNPKDRAELVLGAIDELPIDLAFAILDEGGRRTRARAGEAESDAEAVRRGKGKAT